MYSMVWYHGWYVGMVPVICALIGMVVVPYCDVTVGCGALIHFTSLYKMTSNARHLRRRTTVSK